MKVLIVGSGGREHALGYKIKQSPAVSHLYFAPGNGGTCSLGKNVDIPVTEIERLKDFAAKEKIDLTVVGPELPLSLGIVDAFRNAGLTVFGPDKTAAQLETSKAFSKKFMQTYQIPTADYQVFNHFTHALDYLQTACYPIVIKADGLAAGKGVVICKGYTEAERAIQLIMQDRVFGSEGETVVIEEFLEGKEVSMLCFTDTQTIVPMESASDYKRAFDNDEGLNTGGMGSISPSFYGLPHECLEIAEKTLKGLQKEGFDYRGVIYIGLMLTATGPKVLEYNVRFGDPETEALLPRLTSDLFLILKAVSEKRLKEADITWSEKPALTVILAAQGYPESYSSGEEIVLPPQTEELVVFHSGTRCEDGRLLSSGGRVLAVTAVGDDMKQARKTCYDYIKTITFPNSFHRTDIGEEKK